MIKVNVMQKVVLIVLILFVIFAGYFVIKEFLRISELSSEINLLRQEIASNNITVNQLKQLKKTTDSLAEQDAEIKKLIPAEPLEEQIVSFLQNSSGASSLVPVTIRFTGKKENGNLGEVPMELSFSGSYRGFMNLLSYMMYGDRLFRIDGVKLGENGGILTINLTANAFYQTR